MKSELIQINNRIERLSPIPVRIVHHDVNEHHLRPLGRLAERAALIGALIAWFTGSRFGLTAGQWATTALTILLFRLQ